MIEAMVGHSMRRTLSKVSTPQAMEFAAGAAAAAG